MASLDSLSDGLDNLLQSGKGLLGNPIATALGGAVVGGALTGAAIAGVSAAKKSSSSSSRKRSSKTRKRITHTKRGWKQDRARFNKRQKWEVAYRKRKAKRTGKVKYTKNGQPYIILSSGKAKFIKKRRRS